MSDHSEKSDSKAIGAVTELVKAVPVYQDLVQPAAREVGQNLATVAKTISIVLAPLSALVWGYEKIRDFVESRVAEKLEGVPEEQIKPPSPHVAGPALEALRYTGHEETLRELYANLLASSLDSATAHRAHPGFVDIIKNMAPDEARIMQFLSSSGDQPLIDVKIYRKDSPGYDVLLSAFSFLGDRAGCQHPGLASAYIDNLQRLGLVDVPGGVHLTNEAEYALIEECAVVTKAREDAAQAGHRIEIGRKLLHLTTLGRQFCGTCVIDKRIMTQGAA